MVNLYIYYNRTITMPGNNINIRKLPNLEKLYVVFILFYF